MKENHPDIKFGKTGVLLINLGTPDSTDWWDIRRYLKEFLSDTRVIEVNPVLWQIILNLLKLKKLNGMNFYNLLKMKHQTKTKIILANYLI